MSVQLRLTAGPADQYTRTVTRPSVRPMTPHQFIAKWQPADLKEHADLPTSVRR
ncbi:MAG: hypothetical protein MUF18_03790 [Fimbriiglobus sp.]|nr:hypothetical protein [Fimbriiglobus sp.]